VNGLVQECPRKQSRETRSQRKKCARVHDSQLPQTPDEQDDRKPAGTLAAKAMAPSNTSTRARACRPRQTSMLMERIRSRIRYRFQSKRQGPVPGIPGLKVLTGVPKVGKGLQTSSAPGDVSRGGAWYFADALLLTRAGSV